MKIFIFCADSAEKFSPRSEVRGVGGSEEAVINISRELVKLGHKITVWNKCEDDAGEYDGVTYRDYLEYKGEECDIFIGWRSVQPWKIVKPASYKIGYHWLHDTLPEKEVAQCFSLGARKAMVLSKFHRRLYGNIRNEECFLTRNGINTTHFDEDVKRVKGRMFWSSSYDRGLKELLGEWPKIKLAVPEATLHIAYGWQVIEKRMHESPDFARLKEHIEELMKQDGVRHLGRIGHQEVAREFMEADVWGYPTFYPEISCISAIKAQAAGAIPVVIPTAALAETVQYGYKTDRGYYNDIQGNIVMPFDAMEQWTAKTIEYLQKPEEEKSALRAEMSKWAKEHYSWNKVAKEWEQEFENELRN